LTSDPARAKIRLTISGNVEKFATISPQQVRLVGPGNKQIKQTVLIFPRKAYPFKIIGVKARIGRDIRYSQDVYKDGDAEGYILTVENARETQGRYTDTIYLRTDSDVRPEIAIPVYGDITSDSNTQ
jgi:hypothetical protein